MTNYKCSNCKYVQNNPFTRCPSCGINHITGNNSKSEGIKDFFKNNKKNSSSDNLLGY